MQRTLLGGAAPASRRSRLANLPGALALGILAAAVIVILILIWSVFGSFDPALGRLSPSEHPMFFPIMMVHAVTASLALVTVVLQLWPWLRRRHPRVHRISGRLYVFAAVLPAAITALVLTAGWAYSPLVAFRDVPLAVLWIVVTAYGFALAVRGRYVEHRRWMLRSFAITGAVILSPVLDLWLRPMLLAYLDTHFAGSEFVYLQSAVSARLWLSTFAAFIAVEWWLERDVWKQRRTDRRPVRAEVAGVVPAAAPVPVALAVPASADATSPAPVHSV
jgi:hypothetical protein